MFCIKAKTFFHWYKEHLSDYNTDIELNHWCKEKIETVNAKTGEFVEKPLYVCKPENIGSNMCIDDKALLHSGFTVLSNADTNKIALLVETTKATEVEQSMEKLGNENLQKIRHISMDMSATYSLVFDNLVPRAVQVIDKYHAIKYVYEALCDVRKQAIKDLQQQLTQGTKRNENDKQVLQQIERLRRISHAITQSPDKWSEYTEEIMNQSFAENDRLKMAYEISQKFKQWYCYENHTKSKERITAELYEWYGEAVQINEFKSVIKMLRKHEAEIINFFRHGLTNAKAERLNGKMQRFYSANYGTNNKDFFLYRTAGYFS
jgi:transposase